MIAALSLSACKSNKTTTNKDLLMLQDSSGVSNGSYLTDTGNAVNATPVLAPVVTAPAVRKRQALKKA